MQTLNNNSIELLQTDFEEKLKKYGLPDFHIKLNPNMDKYIYYDIFKEIIEKEDINHFFKEFEKNDSIDLFMNNYDFKGKYDIAKLSDILHKISNTININSLYLNRLKKHFPDIYEKLYKIVKDKQYDVFYDINMSYDSDYDNDNKIFIKKQFLNDKFYMINILKLFQHFS